MTTYKGHTTVNNTLSEWARSGLLQHPQLRGALLHVNRCTCADSAFLKAAFAKHAPGLPLRLICLRGNRLHPQALLASFAIAETRFVLFAENDRPTLLRTGESEEGLRRRVRRGIDTALRTAGQRATPFVLIHRFGASRLDELQYEQWLSGAARAAAAGDPVPALPVELTRPHQHPGDVTRCWRVCLDLALAHRQGGAASAAAKAYCATLLGQNMANYFGGAPRPSVRGTLCDHWACREWNVWQHPEGASGGVGGPDDQTFRDLMCLQPWLRWPGPPAWMRRHRLTLLELNASDPDAPQLTCTRSSHWVNAPAIFSRSWYLDVVGNVMCWSPKAQVGSGLAFLPRKKYYGHYGKKMEQYLIKNMAGQVVCHLDGITEHVELEDFLGDRVLQR